MIDLTQILGHYFWLWHEWNEYEKPGVEPMKLIGVIADDLTGAAELGGVGFRCDLESEVHLNMEGCCAAKLAAFDTDSRSCSKPESRELVQRAVRHLNDLRPEFIYKKVDSALRGRILIELDALAKAVNLKRSLLVPANPSLNRLIREGRYYINGLPIHQTGFKNDPEYPCRSSSVLEILGRDLSVPVTVCRPDDSLPAEGIIIGETHDLADLDSWAARLDGTIVAAGAAEFFAAILRSRGILTPELRRDQTANLREREESSRRTVESREGTIQALTVEQVEGLPDLFVCGSASDAAQQFLKDARVSGIPISSMPSELIESGSTGGQAASRWLAETLSVLAQSRRVVVAIDRPLVPDPAAAKELLRHLINLTEAVLNSVSIAHLFVEGGATAAGVLRRMNWQRMKVVHEFSQGVVSLKPIGLSSPIITMKPGSYVWPRKVWSGKKGDSIERVAP